MRMRYRRVWLIGLLVTVLLSSCGAASGHQEGPVTWLFQNPRRVTVLGYNKSLMEAFVSRDGRTLFFNSWREGQKDLYYATHIDDVRFQFQGEIRGVNMPTTVEGVPTMIRDGTFYYVSTVHDDAAHQCTLAYQGLFNDGTITQIRRYLRLRFHTHAVHRGVLASGV